MNDTRSLFVEALRKATTDKYCFVPAENEISYRFSDEFTKKIERICLQDDAPFLFFLQKKRLIVFVLIVMLLLVTVGCAVPQIRENVLDYFIATYKHTYTVYWKNGFGLKNIEEYYLPAFLPDGFSLVHYETDDNELTVLYEKNTIDGKIVKIEFYQQIIPKNGLSFRKEDGIFEKYEHEGQITEIYKLYDKITVFCEKDGYLFKIISKDSVLTDDIVKMINSIEVTEQIQP